MVDNSKSRETVAQFVQRAFTDARAKRTMRMFDRITEAGYQIHHIDGYSVTVGNQHVHLDQFDRMPINLLTHNSQKGV